MSAARNAQGSPDMFCLARKTLLFCMAMFVLALSSACAEKDPGKDKSIKLSKRLEVLFQKTKLVCFGRYALEVPIDAQLIRGQVFTCQVFPM
ncbi:hypothetical protein [Janthinobacterium sp. MDB2-8]|uniref:hypothetical protein n=1 Tax=Janthinobacterium sp. MDB2-8 TaxID=1259338 RepID=UPI003F2889C4